MDFLCRIVEAVIKAGATTVNIPDTVGYTVPEEYTHFMRTLIERVPNSDKAVFSVHCHNDLGMAVANSLAGIAGGARQVECTVNGIGERAGNAALEEIVMAINVRNDKFPWWNKIDTTRLTSASKLVSAATSFPVQYNKAIVGRNAFAHESGIHQDGVLKDASTYEIMRPEMVGLKQSSLVLGKHSGRHAFVHKLEEMGYKLGPNQLEDAFTRMKALADRKKDIYDEDIEALLDERIAAAYDRIKLTSLTVIAGTHGPQRATMKLDIDGQVKIEEAEGNGPVDAVFNCIKALVPHEAKLELYQVHAVTEGTDAQAEVSVRLSHDGRVNDGACGRSGYAGGFRQSLSRRVEQDRHEAPARRAAGHHDREYRCRELNSSLVIPGQPRSRLNPESRTELRKTISRFQAHRSAMSRNDSDISHRSKRFPRLRLTVNSIPCDESVIDAAGIQVGRRSNGS